MGFPQRRTPRPQTRLSGASAAKDPSQGGQRMEFRSTPPHPRQLWSIPRDV